MRVVLDTHYVYALAGAPGELSAAERRFLAQPPAPLVISAVSIWELRLKWQALHAGGERKGLIDPQSALLVLAGQFPTMLPLLASHAAARLDVPIAHHDPFDEALLVQAQVESFRLMTRDRALAGHPLTIQAG